MGPLCVLVAVGGASADRAAAAGPGGRSPEGWGGRRQRPRPVAARSAALTMQRKFSRLFADTNSWSGEPGRLAHVCHGVLAVNPSQPAIEAAIAALEAGQFQRLAEDYARIRWPERFDSLATPGRNAAGQTTAGFPDAFATLVDGRLDAVEATRQIAWFKHARADLAKAQAMDNGALAGYVLVTWARQGKASNVREIRNAFVSAGLEPQLVDVVFRQQLVTDIAQPRYARLWRDLGLPATVHPWIELEHAVIYGRETSLGLLPARSELVRGEIEAPHLAAKVVARLADENLAIVRGHGASGKTTLAAIIGLDFAAGGAPVYYVDLAGGADTAALLDVFATRSDRGVLWIVDNIHRFEDAASNVYRYWDAVHDGSQLLLVGRPASMRRDRQNFAQPLDMLDKSTLWLTVGASEMRLVCRRLVRVRGVAGEAFEDPPDSVLTSWAHTFGGDLVAFAFSVVRNWTQLVDGDWQLVPGDARQHIRERYLDPLSSEQLAMLLMVSALARLEIEGTSLAIDLGLLNQLVEDGILVVTTRNNEERVFLAHPGMADLVAEAADAYDDADYLLKACARDPRLGMEVAKRLIGDGQSALARAVLREGLTNGGLGRMLTAGHTAELPQRTALVVGLTEVDDRDIDEALTPYAGEMASDLVRAALGTLVGVYGYVRRRFPSTAAELAADLQRPARLDRLTARAAGSSIRSLAEGLAMFDAVLPPLCKHVAEQLGGERYLQDLTSKALEVPVDEWNVVIKVAGLVPQIAMTLTDVRNIGKLRDVLSSDIGLLGEKLNQARARAPKLYEAIMHVAVDSEFRSKLAQHALGGVGTYGALRYAEKHDQELDETLRSALRNGTSNETLLAGLGLSARDTHRLLRYLRQSEPEAYDQVARLLEGTEGISALLSAIMTSPMAHGFPLLNYLMSTAPVIGERVLASAASARCAEALARLLERGHPRDLVRLLKSPFGEIAVQGVDLAAVLCIDRRAEMGGELRATLAEEFERVGRSDIAEALISAARR